MTVYNLTTSHIMLFSIKTRVKNSMYIRTNPEMKIGDVLCLSAFNEARNQWEHQTRRIDNIYFHHDVKGNFTDWTKIVLSNEQIEFQRN